MDNVPFLAFHLMAEDPGTIIHFALLRGSDQLTLDIPVVALPHRIDRLAGDLRATLAGLPADAAVALQIQRNEELSYIAFRLPKS